MNVEIGAEAALILRKEIHKWDFLCSVRQSLGSEKFVFGFLFYAKRKSNSRIISALVLFMTSLTYHPSKAIQILRDIIF
jgi:hypothetical protein